MNRKDGNLTTILNRRVELWGNVISQTKNALGQYPKEEKKKMDLWAAIIPQTGSMLQGRTDETALTRTTHKLVIRYGEGVKPSDWFIYKGQRYDVLYTLDPYANHERLEVFCEAVSLE